ncbi:ABC transporter substrate-binding protein [Streptomyces inusitatus]|uniref:ABC transporter substrate-binding protein n=1 Tax=Streptomyces inusitatus TaxID=68221 RepID=UPI00167EBF3B|nr:ABC transporter substrate-binding protein [Streptomyces inusitatus]
MTPQRSSRTRRIAGAALVVAALTATAACGGGSKDGKEGGDGKAAGFNAAVKGIANPSVKKGGTLKFIGKQDFDSTDPQRQYYGFAWDFSRFYSRQLVSYAPKPGPAGAELVPDLAKAKGVVSNDGKTYTYELRDGITWEDGTPVTSQDIKYGIERTWASDVITGGPAYLRQVLDPKNEYKGPYKDTSPDKLGLKAVQTPDAKTIVFNLAKPNGDFEQMLAMPAGSPVKKEKDTGAKYQLKPFSSGPYKFESYSPKKGAVLVRNDKWQKASDPIRAALPDKITVTVNSNIEAIDELLIKGDYDLDMNATGMSQAGRTKALQKHKANVDNIETSFIRYVDIASKVKPFDNVECRKAVIYAADYKSMQTVRGGPEAGGDIATNMLPKSIKGSDDYDPYGILARDGKPDVAKAKAALKACGKPDGFSTNISARSNNPGEVQTAEALQQSLQAVGIKAEVEAIDGAESSTITGSPAVVKQRGLGLVMTGWGPDFPTGQGFSQPLVDGRFIAPNGNYNVSETNDPKINKLFDDALQETDADKAGEIYKEMNHAVSDRAAQMPFIYEKNFTWRSSRLTNAYSTAAYNGRYDYVSLGVVK